MLASLLAWLGFTRRGLGGSALGARGEAEAERYLRRRGYTVLDRNVRVAVGEADLVARSPEGVTVVVEVKTRRLDTAAGARPQPRPEARVGPVKRRTLGLVLQRLCRANQWQHLPKRIDIVAVEIDRADRVVAVRHHKGV